MKNRYKFAETGNKVIAISTYAGKPVKGIAKCDPQDTFSIDFGKKLARARCDEKVSKKRHKNAHEKTKAAHEALIAARKLYDEMVTYEMDSYKAMRAAEEYTKTVLAEAK